MSGKQRKLLINRKNYTNTELWLVNLLVFQRQHKFVSNFYPSVTAVWEQNQ